MRPSRRRFGLACAAVVAVFVTAWLTLSVPAPHSLAQDSPPGTPEQQGQSPIETPEGEPATDTATPTSTPTETPTETPLPPAEPVAETPTPPLAEPPTETPTPAPEEGEAPTPEPSASPQETAPEEQATEAVEIETAPETATPTPRPIEFPSPTPTPNILMLMDRGLTGMLGAAAWIWFVCGSLLFFVVAGTVAGLGFYRRERNRYQLYELAPDEETPAQQQAQTKEDDDAWPPSLP